VHPPGSEEFESTAVGWLLDVVPPDYRLHGVLRRYPVALAALARYHSKACVEGARQGYRTARTELAGALPPHAIDTVLAAYRKEGARLAATAQAVDLVERALRGEVFTPKMSLPPTAPERQSAEPEGTEPERTEPRRTGRQSAEPEAAEPEAAEPEAAEPEAAEPEAEQKAAAPRAAKAKTAEQKAGGAKAGARRNSAGRGRSDLART
jgi:outer membrane biosynthesis protein TonB